MSAAHVAALALMWAGVTVVVASSLCMLLFRDALQRLHYLTPVTSLGVPLIGLALAIENGWGLTTAELLLITFFVVVTGPVLGSATARLVAEHRGLVPRKEPE
jgi:multicomponent Na+:H+ antiporter subunit G